jgi:hypothetical protein
MRSVLVSVAFAMIAMMTPAKSANAAIHAAPAISAAAAPVVALQIPDKTIQITVGDRPAVRWYRNPVWIAIGAIAVVVILLLLVMAVRGGGGGGTTIVKG